MNLYTPPTGDDIKTSDLEDQRNVGELAGEAEMGDLKLSAEELAVSFRRMSNAAIRETETLINQLQKLRTRRQTAGIRIEGEIAEYTELSQQTMQLTSIIVDSVSKLPAGKPR
jgi:hypothetical protein